MPNWCENKLTVSGKDKEVGRFVEFAKGDDGDLDFNRFIPYPKRYIKMDKEAAELEARLNKMSDVARKIFIKLHGLPKDGYNSGGHEWCVKNWGTKWNTSGVNADSWSGEAQYHFLTAWAPPQPVIVAMSKKFPTLTFRLYFKEEGMAFEGDMECFDGAIIREENRNL